VFHERSDYNITEVAKQESICYTLPIVSTTQDHQPILDAQLSQLEITFQEGSAIDAKALAILAVNVALLIFMAQGQVYFSEWWQNASLYGPFFVSLAFNGVAIWPRDYFGPGLTPTQLTRHLTLSNNDLVLQLISSATNAVETNTAINDQRWNFCLRSIIFTVIGSGAILLYFM
jgi:hypothetical protein